MSREDWSVDGYLLTQGVVRDVELRDDLYGVASLRGEDKPVGRNGRLWVPKKLDENAFVLHLWLGGADRAAWEQLYDELLRQVYRPQQLCTWTRTLAGGSSRQCRGYVSELERPVPLGQSTARLSMTVTVPSGVWLSGDVRTATVALPGAGQTGGTTYSLTVFADATAPLEELAVTVTGQATNVYVNDQNSLGPGFTLTGTIGPGQTTTVDSASWLVTGQLGVSQLKYSGDRFLSLTQGRPLGGVSVPTVYVSADSVNGSPTVTVTGRSAFLA